MDLRRIGFPGVIVAGLALALAGCGSTSPTAKTTVTVTRPPASPSASSSSPAAPKSSAPAPTATSQSSATDPATVVQSYFAAINAKDYAKAWELGGKNLGGSYGEFASGFATTVSDDISILSTSGKTVTVHLTATQTDGTQKEYTGTYTVTGSEITHASITEVGGQATNTSSSTCGAPANPYGLNFCGRGSLIRVPPDGICYYFECIDNFDNGHGYMVQCNDGQYSMSGGKDDVCSYHDGVGRTVYSGG